MFGKTFAATGLLVILSIVLISGPEIIGPGPYSRPKSAPKTNPFFVC